ncbi:hypothetical protein QYE76_056415 [Lolium multiflorum]|uniref:Amino acid transporter transmembrane domain-containing protein n=1 Tax=Lolium multiflorum TaxID=4521 RepID=A0AAD8T2X3_LOLMU|nr:hypothetical protein QYE76_056415 [Lolium multiflorum]
MASQNRTRSWARWKTTPPTPTAGSTTSCRSSAPTAPRVPIGAGIMALPATMKVLGVAVGLVSILVMGVLSEVTIELLVRFSARCRMLSYGELVHRALGRPASVVAQMCVIINNAGILVVYLNIIRDVMLGSLKHAGVVDHLMGSSCSGAVNWIWHFFDLGSARSQLGVLLDLGSARAWRLWESGRATAEIEL